MIDERCKYTTRNFQQVLKQSQINDDKYTSRWWSHLIDDFCKIIIVILMPLSSSIPTYLGLIIHEMKLFFL